MNQSILLLQILSLLFTLSLQTQLFREFTGSTDQNFAAQTSQWTLRDPLGTKYPVSISECLTGRIAFKPDSLPSGTTLSKTFNDLEDHKLIRFYVQIYYMGDFTTQTVEIKFDDVVLETSQVIPLKDPWLYDECSNSFEFATKITYYGVVPHINPSVTVEFRSNLHDSSTEITWGLRSLSVATDSSDTIIDAAIYSFTFLQATTIPEYPCRYFRAYIDDQGDCQSCNSPCQECFGPDADQCLTYPPYSNENRLCPEGQTFLSSGCTACAVENCPLCDEDVNQCDTCLNTCAVCDDWSLKCLQCNFDSNLVLYEGDCIESCPLGMYAESGRICQFCQPGCIDCTGPQDCVTCNAAETTNINGLCICNQPRMYFERDLGCTGTCLLGCEQCISGDTCLICDSGTTTIQPNGDCRCNNNGFYYQDETGSCTGQCYEFCEYCHDATSCLSCSGSRISQGGVCTCESSRVLIGNNCECPSFMIENPLTSSCDDIHLVDVIYQSTVSPLFDAIFQVRMNPIAKWTSPPSINWMLGECTFQNFDIQNEFLNYLFMQNSDVLLIPPQFLEHNFQCSMTLFYTTGDTFLTFPVSFKALSPAQPQINIRGGPLQMLNHAEQNLVTAQVQSSNGKDISPSNLKVTWTQTSGDNLDMSFILDSSKPLQLTIPKCTLEKGKIYKFKLAVELLVNPGSKASQEITIGVYAPKFQVKITKPTDNYHLSSKSLTLQSQLSFQQDNDECTQTSSLSDILDLSTAMYTWECFYLDLQLSPTRRVLDESSDIAKDSSVIDHPDPLKLFYQSTSSSTLTIPNSYFTDFSDFQFMFYLTVTVQNKDQTPSLESFTVLKPTLEILKTKIHLAIVSTSPFTSVSFTCSSGNNCQAYSQDFPTKLVGTSYNHQYSYNWALNTLQKISYTTFIRVFENNDIWDWTVVARILYTVSDGTNIASAFMTLPLNPPPESSFVSVYPTEGEAYNTKFFVTTYGWKDTDLPVTYQFYTSYNPFDLTPVKNKMIKTLNPFDFTPMAPWLQNTQSSVSVTVQDNLMSTADSSMALVSFSSSPQTFCEAVEKSSQALTTSRKVDSLHQRFRLISVISENLGSWERNFDFACANEEYDLKFTAITQARDIVENLGSKQEFKIQLFNAIVSSSIPDFNEDKNWNLYTEIVDSDILPNNPILSPEEYNLLFIFTDYQINYMKKPNSTIEDPAKIFSYINVLLKSTLYDLLPVEEGINYQGYFFSSFSYKTTYCKVLQEKPYFVYGLEGLQANVTLRPGQSFPAEKCNDLINMVFLSFRQNYTFDTGSPEHENPQQLIYFDLLDSVTGKSLLDIFTFMLISPISICPVGTVCNPTGDGGTEIYGIFDLRNQINKIFAKSNIDQIQNIAVLAHFKFWKSVAFWTVLVFSLGFLLSFYWLSVKHPTYCALTANKSIIITKPLLKKINLFFWVIHPLVGIYIYNDAKTTKPVKLAIYYQRLVIVMVFSTIFSSLSQGEGWIFKGYILLFNTVTVTPVNSVFSRIFEWAFKMNSGKKLTSRISLFIGVFSYLVLIVACFLVMFIIEAQQDASQNKSWAINFVIAFVQDLSLSPALTAINKVLLIKVSKNNRVSKTLLKSPRVSSLLLPETFTSIYQTIFVPATVKLNAKEIAKEAGLSPRTTTMSPLSSNRKFLKFTTFDLQPQSTTQRNPLQSEFRTRIASENEIGSVDFAPVETLISNRFQTLFPEARAETIRPTSPTKQNFEKMQTTNIYSKNSLTNFPTLATTLKGSILKQSNVKPFQTIEFNAKEPVEMTLDDIFQFAEQPEEGEEIRASQLKLFKNINTMDSPIREKKKNTPISSYLPSVELSLEQRISEKNNKKKGILKQNETKPFQMIDLSSSNQIKSPGQAGSPHEELSSFDGNIEETHYSQIKLFKNNSNAMESQIREKKRNTLAPSYLPSVELSLEQRISEKNNATMKKKPFQLMDLSSMNQLKEPSAIHPDELSSFDGNPEETFVSQLKLLKNNSKQESPIRDKRKDLTKSAPKITIGDFSSGDLPSVPKKFALKKDQFKYNEKTTNKPVPSIEVSSVLQFKEPPGFEPDEFSSFDENIEETVVSLPKFKTAESTILKQKSPRKKEVTEKLKNVKR